MFGNFYKLNIPPYCQQRIEASSCGVSFKVLNWSILIGQQIESRETENLKQA